jgi:patatin-like phospholipase/acyl hydrolase
MATISVLSIDGGGIRGLIPAAFLAQLEARTGQSIASLFDYVAGTSTGGILALGLTRSGAGLQPLSAEAMINLYKNEGGRIFNRSFWHTVVAIGQINGPKYPADGPDQVLHQYFGESRFKDCKSNVLITAYEIERRKAFFFRSWQAKAMPASHDFNAWEVARSTSAAPTFFPPHQIKSADGSTWSLVDGGMYANNPALCAWVEAHDQKPGDEIFVVSLGTGNLNRKVPYAQAKDWGLVGWAPWLIDIIFDGQSDTSDIELDEMLNTRGGADRYYRFQCDLTESEQPMDDTDPGNLSALEKLGRTLAQGARFDEVCSRLVALQGERRLPAA